MKDHTGWIKWPDRAGWRDAGEGGLWVYAFWLAPDADDPFVKCHGVEAVVALPQPDVVVSDRSVIYRKLPDWNAPMDAEWEREMLDGGESVLAAVCLGSTNITYVDDDGYFQCDINDLTPEGTRLIETLNRLYDREAVLITYLDT